MTLSRSLCTVSPDPGPELFPLPILPAFPSRPAFLLKSTAEPLNASTDRCSGAPGPLCWEALELSPPGQSHAKTCGLALPLPGTPHAGLERVPSLLRALPKWVGGGARVRGVRRQEHYWDPRGGLPWQPTPSHLVIRRPSQGGPDRRRGLVRQGAGLWAETIKAPRALSSSFCSALPDFWPRAAAAPAPAPQQRGISGRLRRKVSAEAAGCFPGG